MRHRHKRTEPVEALADLLQERHGVELSSDDLAGALESLNLVVGPSGPEDPGDVIPAGEPGALVCIDGPEGCDGEPTTLLDTRHVRCERHWSLFLESEGM